MCYLFILSSVHLEVPETKSTMYTGRGMISRRKFARLNLDLNLEVQVSLKNAANHTLKRQFSYYNTDIHAALFSSAKLAQSYVTSNINKIVTHISRILNSENNRIKLC